MEAEVVEINGSQTPSIKIKSPKVSQVQRFYGLLCECGIDNYVQAVLELRNKKLEKAGSKPITAGDQRTGDEIDITAEDMMEIHLSIDLGNMMRVLSSDNRLIELVSLVMDVSLDDASDVTIEEFSENFSLFAAGSLNPISALLSFGRSVG